MLSPAAQTSLFPTAASRVSRRIKIQQQLILTVVGAGSGAQTLHTTLKLNRQ
jgi:hypothetical protein